MVTLYKDDMLPILTGSVDILWPLGQADTCKAQAGGEKSSAAGEDKNLRFFFSSLLCYADLSEPEKYLMIILHFKIYFYYGRLKIGFFIDLVLQ